MHSPPVSPIRIFLLGRFEVSRGERVLPAGDWSRRKAAALLQRLALERRLLKDQAIDFLWPDATLAAGANNLYRTLHALRHTLDAALGPGAAEATFAFEDGILSLHDSVWVDVEAFQQLLSRPINASGSPSSAQQALALYQGDLLPDELYAEWTLVPREALRRQRREAALSLAAAAPSAGSDAVALLTPLLAQDPADEPVHRALMRAYALAGRRHDALRQYQACVEALAAELDVPPEPETTALYTQILKGELAPSPALHRGVLAMPPAGSRKYGVGSMELESGVIPTAPSSQTPYSLLPTPYSILPPESVLAGREAELERLRAELELARHGQGRTILLAGDPGVGKTRLAYEALRIAAAGGMTTLFGAAYEQEGQLPYQPLIEAFDRYLAEHRGPAAAGGSGGEPRANPITHFRRPGVVLAGGAVLEGGSGDLQREHWALFDAAAGFLLDLAAEAPVVLLVDDLHAADQSTLHLFHYLARQTRAAPVTLLATYRTDVPATPASPFAALLNALYRERLSQTSSLAPLGVDALGSVLADTLGGEAAPELVKAVFEVAEGNPFHAQEIARALLKSGEVLAEVGSLSLEFELGVRIPVSNSKLQTQTPNSEGGEVEQHARRWRLKPGAELRVPSGLSALLRERVMRLGPPVESALTAAAVIGREFNFEVLRATASLPDGELFDALDAALAGHLLEETDGGYRFRHSLIRRALYDSLSRVRRARLHTRAAEAIELTYARGPEGLRPHAEALAFHYDLSDRRDRALDYLVQAGERAAGVYAFEVAVDYFQRALALMDALGLADPARRWQLLESLGRWGIILADTPRAVAHFEQAIALFTPPAPQRSPAERQGRGVPDMPPSGGLGGEGWQPARRDRARLHGGAAMALLTAGQTAAAEAHLRAGLGEVDEDEDAAEYADLLYNLAQLHWHRDEYELAFGAAQRSLAVAERLNHREAIARAFEMLALVCHSLGEWQTGIGYEEQRAALTGPGLDVTDAFDVHL